MKQQTKSIVYWTSTLLFALLSLFSGITEVLQTEQAQAGMIALGYPLYFLMILGGAKILGSLALVYTKWPILTEWAYAGFTFDIIAASLSIAFAGGGISLALFPLVFLVVLSVSYSLWKQR